MTELENLNNYVKALEEKLLQHEKWDTEEHQAIREEIKWIVGKLNEIGGMQDVVEPEKFDPSATASNEGVVA